MNNYLTFLIIVSVSTYVNKVGSLDFESINGGYEAAQDDFKYQVAINAKNYFFMKPELICGGVIIHKDLVMSAAHCAINNAGHFKLYWYEVIVGSWNLNIRVGITFDVNTVYVYENYNWITLENDILIMKLNRSLSDDQKSHWNIIDFAIRYDPYEKVTATISGYGQIWTKVLDEIDRREILGHFDYKLRYARIRIVSNKECGEIYRVKIHNYQLCGKIVTENEQQLWGVSVGDSGGPLVYNNQVIGILSSIAVDVVDTSLPAKYTRVSSYIFFILSIINNNPLPGTRIKDSPLIFKNETDISGPSGTAAMAK